MQTILYFKFFSSSFMMGLQIGQEQEQVHANYLLHEHEQVLHAYLFGEMAYAKAAYLKIYIHIILQNKIIHGH